MADIIIKRPDDIAIDLFDFRSFATSVGSPVTYLMRAEAGPVISQEEIQPGLFKLTIYGGRLGRVYAYGMEARSESGDSEVFSRTLRIREVSSLGDVPVITPTLEIYLVDEDGNALIGPDGSMLFANFNLLVTAGGDALVNSGGFALVSG